MAFQAVDQWAKNESMRSMTYPPSAAKYSVHYLGESDSTRIQDPLMERILIGCGSGSWCDSLISQLKARIISDDFSGGWTVITLPLIDARKNNSPTSLAEKLVEIRDAFGLSIAVLADVLRASRASVYNWYENEPGSEDVIKRIEIIHEFACDWMSKNPYHFAPGRLMKQRLGNGPSMLDRLSREVLDVREIQEGMDNLLMLMTKKRARMDRSKARSEKVAMKPEAQQELLERLTGSVAADR